MTAVIIEDEIPAANRLQKLLISKEFEVLTTLHSVKNAIQWFKENNHPDCVFVDIKLRDGNCFEILDKITLKSKIIFTTAYNEFALNAFNYNSVDYLLKPIDEEKLDKLILKIETLRIGFQHEFSWKDFEQNDYQKIKNSFLVSSGSLLKKINDLDIICFYSDNNSTFLLNNVNRSFIVNKSLEKLEEELNPNLFFRINRKFIINKSYIQNVKNEYQKQIFLSIKTDFEFIISKLKVKAFLDWYKK
ncbi:LytTR family DNA-binding domain-containing protein [Flavobacterium sp.]|uniref:LytR/AlgR family response regulator transcription factor n=1 Tax=Flavobacterium sp. TaxID=239 RepID=UPI0026356BC6|nr:LytTR family DNA-binding domain-containing protein [Flavobacterium sp.]